MLTCQYQTWCSNWLSAVPDLPVQSREHCEVCCTAVLWHPCSHALVSGPASGQQASPRQRVHQVRYEGQTGALVVDRGVGDGVSTDAVAGVLQHFGEVVAVGQLTLCNVDLRAPSSILRLEVPRKCRETSFNMRRPRFDIRLAQASQSCQGSTRPDQALLRRHVMA